jgi:hypothetical protein
MAKQSIIKDEAATAVAEGDPGEQGNMFPDLDKSKPDEAALLKVTRTWLGIRDKRKEYLTDAKEKEDDAHTKMCELAKKVGIKTYSVGERQINLEDYTKAKVKQKKNRDDDEGEDGDDEE